ncbi:MAG: protease, partial [Bacteroidales bacterium]
MNQKLMYVVIAFLFFPFLSDAQDKEARLLRFPAIYENQIVFSYAGDLYSVDADGGTARRLTSHKGYEMFPRFSPDGSRIAFTGQYDGNTEVFVMPAEGGSPKRLTYTATLGRDDVADRMGPNNITMTWTPDGESIIYRSRQHSFNSFKGGLYKIPVEGGISEKLPFTEGGFCSFSEDGSKLAYNKVFREFRTWKHYEGGMADDIWIHDFETHETKAITDHKAQDIIPMWRGNKIYFASDRNWRMNLFSYDLETEEVKQLTDFEEFDVKFPSIGKDYIVFENGGFIYKLNLDTEEVNRVPVKIKNDLLASRNEMVDVSEDIQHAGLSPNGERAVFSSRGDVFSVPAKNGITYNLTRSQNVHDRNAEWSPDGKHIAYISDQTGEYEIFMVDKDRNNEPVQLTEGNQSYKYNIDWSPDSKKILWSNSEFELKYVDTQTKEVKLVDTSEYGQILDYNWAPDSKWITYSKQADNNMAIVWMYNTESGEKIKATEKWYSSSGANFSTDGKYL